MMTPQELFLNFESFGDNCEFGLVQRHAGIEPLGLFRFSFMSMPALRDALNGRFKQFSNIDEIEVLDKNQEYDINVKCFKMVYHTERRKSEIDRETLKRDEHKKLKFLARHLVNRLNTGEKIFVRKGDGSKTLADAETLLNDMNAYGPATLFWVTEADSANPPGSVHVVAPRLIQGYIDHFAPYDDAHSINFTNWLDICQSAYRLWRDDAPPGTSIPAPLRDDANANLLRHNPEAERDALRRVMLQHHNMLHDVVLGTFPYRSGGGDTLCRGTLIAEGLGMIGSRVSGLDPGATYTFSLWLRLEPRSGVRQVAPHFPGLKSIRKRLIDRRVDGTWQRLEVSAVAPEDGIMFPRIDVRGPAGTGFYLANWRLDAGLAVAGDAPPGRPAS